MVAVDGGGVVIDVIGPQLQEGRRGKRFEAGKTEAKDLGTRPSSGMKSQ